MSATDRLDVIELFARLAKTLDEARYEDISAVYTEDVAVQSPRAALNGLAAVRKFLDESHVEDERTQHIHSNVLVSVDGDEARASANQLVHYYRDGAAPHRTSSLRLAYDAVRTPAGWRFRKGSLSLAWTQQH